MPVVQTARIGYWPLKGLIAANELVSEWPSETAVLSQPAKASRTIEQKAKEPIGWKYDVVRCRSNLDIGEPYLAVIKCYFDSPNIS
jgi:hypothetical protein